MQGDGLVGAVVSDDNIESDTLMELCGDHCETGRDTRCGVQRPWLASAAGHPCAASLACLVTGRAPLPHCTALRLPSLARTDIAPRSAGVRHYCAGSVCNGHVNLSDICNTSLR